MNSSFIRSIRSIALIAVGCVVSMSGLTGCGSGKGSGLENEPAPQTFNGLVLTLFQGGPKFTFIRSEGNAVNGVEVGAVDMDDNPSGITSILGVVDASRVVPPTRIVGARYEYRRTGPESGVLRIFGQSTNIQSTNARYVISSNPLIYAPVNYLRSGFDREFFILFGTDGNVIHQISANDVGQPIPGENNPPLNPPIEIDDPYPGILWNTGSLRMVNNFPVPIGFDLRTSAELSLPKIYPESINLEDLIITPDDPGEDELFHYFLESQFTRFSDRAGDFIEKGIGNRNVVGDPAVTLINFDYNPDPETVSNVRIRINAAGEPEVTYHMIFLDFKRGTYVRGDGATGTFEFPLINR
jgi:hypothetical protein